MYSLVTHRDFVKNGLFGDGFDSHLRSERRRVRERVGPLDKAAAQINFDDEARRILSMKLNLGPNGVNDRNDTYNDYDVLYRCPKGGNSFVSSCRFCVLSPFIAFSHFLMYVQVVRFTWVMRELPKIFLR